MALKFRLDQIGPDVSGHVAYVQLYDDAKPDVILSAACVPYTGVDAEFALAVEKKFSGAIAKVDTAKLLKEKVAALLAGIDASKISSTEESKT